MSETTKKCKKCGEELSLENFYRNKTSKDGYKASCKKCSNEKKIRVNSELAIKLKNGTYTYKQLCDIGVFFKYYPGGGNSKKIQLEELMLYRDINMSKGGKIIMGNIYKEKKIDFMKSDFMKYIQCMIIDKLVIDMKTLEERENYKDFGVITTTKILIKHCNMVNDNYFNKPSTISKSIGVDLAIVWDVMNGISSFNSRIIYRTLKDLQDQSLILVNSTPICISNEIMANGEYRNEHVIPSISEKSYIIDCQKKVLENLGLFRVSQAICSVKYKKKFIEGMQSCMDELGFESYYWGYEIIYKKESLEKELSKRKVKELKAKINHELVDRLCNNIDDKKNKAIKEEEIKECIKNSESQLLGLCTDNEVDNMISKSLSYSKKARLGEKYVMDGKIVVKRLISSKTRTKILDDNNRE